MFLAALMCDREFLPHIVKAAWKLGSLFSSGFFQYPRKVMLDCGGTYIGVNANAYPQSTVQKTYHF
jgi:hypothetical protein